MTSITIDNFDIETIEKLKEAGFEGEHPYSVNITTTDVVITLQAKTNKSVGDSYARTRIDVHGAELQDINKLTNAGFETKLFNGSSLGEVFYVVKIRNKDVELCLFSETFKLRR